MPALLSRFLCPAVFQAGWAVQARLRPPARTPPGGKRPSSILTKSVGISIRTTHPKKVMESKRDSLSDDCFELFDKLIVLVNCEWGKIHGMKNKPKKFLLFLQCKTGHQ